MSEFKVGGKARSKSTGEVFTVMEINTDQAEDEYYMEGWGRLGTILIDSPDDVEPVDWEPPTRDEVARVGSRHWSWARTTTSTSTKPNISVMVSWLCWRAGRDATGDSSSKYTTGERTCHD